MTMLITSRQRSSPHHEQQLAPKIEPQRVSQMAKRALEKSCVPPRVSFRHAKVISAHASRRLRAKISGHAKLAIMRQFSSRREVLRSGALLLPSAALAASACRSAESAPHAVP